MTYSAWEAMSLPTVGYVTGAVIAADGGRTAI
jgi:hypothetical protein